MTRQWRGYSWRTCKPWGLKPVAGADAWNVTFLGRPVGALGGLQRYEGLHLLSSWSPEEAVDFLTTFRARRLEVNWGVLVYHDRAINLDYKLLRFAITPRNTFGVHLWHTFLETGFRLALQIKSYGQTDIKWWGEPLTKQIKDKKNRNQEASRLHDDAPKKVTTHTPSPSKPQGQRFSPGALAQKR
jgi:hypothetical protein